MDKSSDQKEENIKSTDEFNLLGFKNNKAELLKPNGKESAEEDTSNNSSMENQELEVLPEIVKSTENLGDEKTSEKNSENLAKTPKTTKNVPVKTSKEYLDVKKPEALSNIEKTTKTLEKRLDTKKSEISTTKTKNHETESLDLPKYKIIPNIANKKTYTRIQKTENISKMKVENTIVEIVKENHTINETASDTAENKKNLKVVKLEVDEKGQKFINLNGKKLKVIREVVREVTSSQGSQVPANDDEQKSAIIYKHKTINIGSPDSPLKVRVISQVTQLDGNLPKKDKIKVLDPSTRKLISESDKRTPLEVKAYSSLESFDDNTPRDYKLLNQNILKVLTDLKMKALNLSLKSPSALQQTPQAPQLTIKKFFVEQAIQTDEVEENSKNTIATIANKDSSCQTDPQNFLDLDWLENDSSPIINNVDFGIGPSMGKVAWPTNNVYTNSVNIKQSSNDNDAGLKKKLQFFQDLRNALLPDANGNLLIHEGVLKQDKDLVKRMCIVLRARHFDVNQETHDGCTPLQLAIINNVRHDIVETLLDYGAEVGDCDGDGNNIIHLAAKFQRYDHLQVIFYHRFFESHFKQFVDHFNFEGLTALMICCMSGWYLGVELFVRNGAGVNIRDQKSGRTPLFHSAEIHEENIVRLLLESGADPKIKNFFGTSPHDAMYELDDMPDAIKGLIFGKTKKRCTDAEMNPTRTAKAAKTLKTYPKFQQIEKRNGMVVVSTGIKMLQGQNGQGQPGRGRIRKILTGNGQMLQGQTFEEEFAENLNSTPPLAPAVINLSELHNQINKQQQSLMLQQSLQQARIIVQKSQT